MPKLQVLFVPNLLSSIFKKYEFKFDEGENSRLPSLLSVANGEFSIELNSVVGSELLADALRLLDEEIITIYGNTSGTQESAEIAEGRTSAVEHKIFTGINYCPCEYFVRHVLKLELPTTSTAGVASSSIESYTCKHVLALRLLEILRVPSQRNVTLPNHIFSYLLMQMQLVYSFNNTCKPRKLHKRNQNMFTQSQYSNFKFVGRLDHIKILQSGLKAINFGKNGFFHINEDGFRITVEQDKSIQASLFFNTSYFSQYHVDGVLNFGVNINVISECLSIFSGIDCSMKMFYKGQGTPLKLIIEPHDEDISTECSIKTSDYEESIDFELDENSASLNIVFVRGPDLATIFNELDKSAGELKIRLSPHIPHFRIDTLEVMQSETSVEVAKTSDMIILFNCRETTIARYRHSQMHMTMKTLAIASKVAIKPDASGLLEMHFMIHQKDEKAEVYVQFYITPLADIDF